jgi:SET domain
VPWPWWSYTQEILEYVGLFQAFANASHEMQHAILQLAATPLLEIEIEMEARQERIEQQRLVYCQRYPDGGMTTELSRKLWAIVECNGVSLFNYHHDNDNNDRDPHQQKWMGLFRQGSMLQHSCNPNVTMNTTREGYLELIAERTIAPGERLSFSYIEGIFEKTRDQRGSCLVREKHFCAPAQNATRVSRNVGPFYFHTFSYSAYNTIVLASSTIVIQHLSGQSPFS